jgi:CheY-like chemotaxis protein
MMAYWMCGLPPTEVANSDASRPNQLAWQHALTHDRASKVCGVAGGRRPLQVLVIDDDRDVADSLVRLIGSWGHMVRWAYDGATGLKVAASQHPDVVLLDLEMPFMDGYEVARQLRFDFPQTACFIIGTTDWFDGCGRPQGDEAGLDMVLVKPTPSPVFETLLMLEHERLNRSQKRNQEIVMDRMAWSITTTNGDSAC